MKRRAYLLGSLGALVAPLVCTAQSPTTKVYRVGLLRGVTPRDVRVWDGFFAYLHELGYVEGHNLVLELREYTNVIDHLPTLADELARLNVDVIVTGAHPAPEAARRATSTIPIVMTSHPHPVESGLVTSLARPGGNVTGLSTFTKELRGKQVQLLKEAVPKLDRVAVIFNRALPTHERELNEIRTVVQPLHLRIIPVEVRAPNEFPEAFAAAAKARASAAIVFSDAMFFVHRVALAELAAKSRLPAMYVYREFVEAGGLMAYGPSLQDTYRRAAWYVDRILKGVKAGDLPIEQPAKFELVINHKTAKTLGLSLPASLLLQADQVLQ